MFIASLYLRVQFKILTLKTLFRS